MLLLVHFNRHYLYLLLWQWKSAICVHTLVYEPCHGKHNISNMRVVQTQISRHILLQHLDSIRDAVHSSAIVSLGPVSRKHQDWFDKNDEEIQELLEEKHQNTRHTLVIPAQYPIRRHIQIYARQSRRGSEICKTPGWVVRLMKSSPLQIERIWRSSLLR